MSNNNKTLVNVSQPGTVTNFHSKPGKSNDLFDLTNKLHFMKTLKNPDIKDQDGPKDWILCRADDDENSQWSMEFYKDTESMERHFNDKEIEDNHDDIINLMNDQPMRDMIHPVYSNTTSGGFSSISSTQPGVILKFQAKAGRGEELFEITNKLHYMKTLDTPTQIDTDGPSDWILCRSKSDPDVLWGLEFYRDESSMKRHFDDSQIESNHSSIIELLEDKPVRVPVHKVFAG